MIPDTPTLAIIEWEDAHGYDEEQDISEVLDNDEPYMITSVGYLLANKPGKVIICQDVMPDGIIRGALHIPRAYIRHFKTVPAHSAVDMPTP